MLRRREAKLVGEDLLSCGGGGGGRTRTFNIHVLADVIWTSSLQHSWEIPHDLQLPMTYSWEIPHDLQMGNSP